VTPDDLRYASACGAGGLGDLGVTEALVVELGHRGVACACHRQLLLAQLLEHGGRLDEPVQGVTDLGELAGVGLLVAGCSVRVRRHVASMRPVRLLRGGFFTNGPEGPGPPCRMAVEQPAR
jgi:hypothetical protein